MLVMRILKHPQHGEIDQVLTELFEVKDKCRRGFQDVLAIQMLAGCTSGISSALIG